MFLERRCGTRGRRFVLRLIPHPQLMPAAAVRSISQTPNRRSDQQQMCRSLLTCFGWSGPTSMSACRRLLLLLFGGLLLLLGGLLLHSLLLLGSLFLGCLLLLLGSLLFGCLLLRCLLLGSPLLGCLLLRSLLLCSFLFGHRKSSLQSQLSDCLTAGTGLLIADKTSHARPKKSGLINRDEPCACPDGIECRSK